MSLFDPLVNVCPQVTNPAFVSTPTVAIDSSQRVSQIQNLNQWFYVSTVQAATPNYVYQYKSQTERIQALQGRLSLNQCR
jgi:hypothetical protein